MGELNNVLQTALNPPAQTKRETRHGSRTFRVGDKVLQTRNNYDKQVFNGDLGRIIEIDFEEQTVVYSLGKIIEVNERDSIIY